MAGPRFSIAAACAIAVFCVFFADRAYGQSCNAVWTQCGGSGFTGATCCESGNTCVYLNDWYSQCIPNSQVTSSSTTTSRSTTTATSSSRTTTTTSSVATSTSSRTTTTASTSSSSRTTTTTTTTTTSSSKTSTTTKASTTTGTSTHTQAAYPSTTASCGSWVLEDGVCCAAYCSNNNSTEDCSSCGGIGASLCISPPSSSCKSGNMYGEVSSISDSEPFHYSRSTHFGLTSGGACGFGLYALCTKSFNWTDATLSAQCSAFCTAYPNLCADPSSTTLRGNFAAPAGNYYTQFWSSLTGDLDNYLSCGECFQLIRTKKDGTDYAVGESGYAPPITLEIIDSCPCSANSKWCCGSGYDHCAEVNDFKYGCPIPSGSIHLDLSDIAMARAQTGDANGGIVDGVIPIRYKRVTCPKVGNAYVWLRAGGGPYYFALSVVNTAGVGSIVSVEVQGNGTSTWTALVRDPNYTSSRPQERYGALTMPQGSGPFNLPLSLRITSPSGKSIVANQIITSWSPADSSRSDYWYIDLGVQF